MWHANSFKHIIKICMVKFLLHVDSFFSCDVSGSVLTPWPLGKPTLVTGPLSFSFFFFFLTCEAFGDFWSILFSTKATRAVFGFYFVFNINFLMTTLNDFHRIPRKYKVALNSLLPPVTPIVLVILIFLLVCMNLIWIQTNKCIFKWASSFKERAWRFYRWNVMSRGICFKITQGEKGGV